MQDLAIILSLIGFFGSLGGMIMLFIVLVLRKSKGKPVRVLLLSFSVFVVGIIIGILTLDEQTDIEQPISNIQKKPESIREINDAESLQTTSRRIEKGKSRERLIVREPSGEEMDPMKLEAILSNRFLRLEIGKSYKVNEKRIMLMPEGKPEDPLEALKWTIELPSGITIKILGRFDKETGLPWYYGNGGNLWYFLAVTDGPMHGWKSFGGNPIPRETIRKSLHTTAGIGGWINSTALIGESLREVTSSEVPKPGKKQKSMSIDEFIEQKIREEAGE